MSRHEHVVVLDHPLVHHLLRWLRDEQTGDAEFRRLVTALSRFVAYEALRTAPLSDVVITTPVAPDVQAKCLNEDYLVVPILRAGLGMVPAVLEVLPRSSVSLVGVRRDEATLRAEVYLDELPERVDDLEVYVCDPMLATGGSVTEVVDRLVARGARTVTVLCLIASRAGLERFTWAHPRVRVVTAAIDDTLDDSGYIVPGLGDAGDRMFGPASDDRPTAASG